MEIQYIGHAGFIIYQNGNPLLAIDPWFNNAFLKTWSPFPFNRHMQEIVKQCKHIIISHEHEDHYDRDFLMGYNGRILVPRYRSNSFRIKLLRDCIRFEEVEPRVEINLDELFINLVIQSAPAWDDCTIIIKDSKSGEVFVNLNDMKPSLSDELYINSKYPSINYLAYQFSGASWHPMCNMDVSSLEYDKVIERKVNNKFKYTVNLINKFNPRIVVPSAGPPIFLKSYHLIFNSSKNAVFPDKDEYIAYLTDKLSIKNIKCFSGSVGDFVSTHSKLLTETVCQKIDRIKIAEEYQFNYDAVFEKVNKKIIRDYLKKSWYDLGDFKRKLDFSILYVLNNEEFVLTNPARGEIAMGKDAVNFDYAFYLSGYHFNLITKGNLTWEELFLSLECKMDFPKGYNEDIITYHKYLHSTYLKDYLRHTSRKRDSDNFIIQTESKYYRVQKRCPHANGDLESGTVEDGCITCPNHGWRFELETGNCLDANSRIYTKKLDGIDCVVREIRKTTFNSISIIFEPTRKVLFEYHPGQYFNLFYKINEVSYQRSYSLTSIPNESNYLSFAVKRVPDGIVSNYLIDHVKVGDQFKISEAKGTFIPTDKKGDFVNLYAAGSGITVIFSLLNYYLEYCAEIEVNLFVSDKEKSEVIFYYELLELQGLYPDRLRIFWFFSQTKEKLNRRNEFSRLSSELLNKLLFIDNYNSNQGSHYICGPKSYFTLIFNSLKLAGVEENSIFSEGFNWNPSSETLSNTIECLVSLKYKDSVYNFIVPQGSSILKSALDNGIDVPYSCFVGSCDTCSAKILNGTITGPRKTKSIVNGEVLMCCSYPSSKHLDLKID